MKVRNSSSLSQNLTLPEEWFHFARKGVFISLSLVVGACSSMSPTLTETEVPTHCVLSEAVQPVTKTCRVFSLSDWDALGLKALDPVSSKVLDSISRSVEGDEVTANFYPTFVKSPSKDLLLMIVDKNGWMLDALVRSSADKASCSYIRDAEALLKEYGGDEQATPEDEKQGNRCGNISIIHSLVRLGVLSTSQAYSGEFLNPDIVHRIDGFHGDKPGMTPDQQQRAYSDFKSTDRDISCDAKMGGKVSDKGSLEMAARSLQGFMRLDAPKYDCSIALWANKRPDGTFGFRHVEHVTGVRVDPSGEYLIDTLDGLLQGENASKIPKTPATNTWRVGPKGADWVQLKDSSSDKNKGLYSGMPIHQIEVRCCNVIDTSGQ